MDADDRDDIVNLLTEVREASDAYVRAFDACAPESRGASGELLTAAAVLHTASSRLAAERNRRAADGVARSEAEMDAAAMAVDYELGMLASAYVGVGSAIFASSDAGNAFLETYLLHTRNVIEFLLGRPDTRGKAKRYRPDDISARSYLPEWMPPEREVERRLLDSLPKIDTQLSHLSWKRVEQEKERWAFMDMVADIAAALAPFATALVDSGSRYGPSISFRLSQLRAAAPVLPSDGAGSEV